VYIQLYMCKIIICDLVLLIYKSDNKYSYIQENQTVAKMIDIL